MKLIKDMTPEEIKKLKLDSVKHQLISIVETTTEYNVEVRDLIDEIEHKLGYAYSNQKTNQRG